MKHSFLFLFLFAFLFVNAYSKTDTVQIASSKTNIVYQAVVVTPASYEQGNELFPTVYLLHGGYGKFSDWTKQISDKSLIQRMSDQYGFIIVMPEGKEFSYYLDSPVDSTSQFESYISKDVIGYIDSNFRTIPKKEGRAITGLSMGGFGSLYISASHPELFIAAGSMSGAVNPDMKEWKLPQEVAKNIEDAFAGILGSKEEFPKRYQEVSIIHKIREYQKHHIRLMIECGVDDFLIEANRELHRRLDFEGISHDYSERDGGHSWKYWENALPYHMLFFANILQK
ncbi:alpha/beta hydrolase [Algoriphagus halophilus]|uniref:S-formylglutathione hydrolase FrmB n=1 Tax=Algoriphagus halophilus TaxID=226505 RepID=A0A1N6H4H5_9BACT|nr:alpha/beta hydrolase family protein [Algoriphagus halophilus]SIO14718.1 S-formylglutathione hydrolase FrmB [Algoriphagus halophilus]